MLAVGAALFSAMTCTPTEPAHAAPLDAQAIICDPYPDWDCDGAIGVAFCESSLNPDATDGVNQGLFAIAPLYHSWRLAPGESLWDPAVNTRIAHDIYVEQGSRPWPSCGRYF